MSEVKSQTTKQISQKRFNEKMDALDAANPEPLARLKAALTTDQSNTLNFDIVSWLYEQGRAKPDACIQERDWCDKMNAAALEIERLREVVWLYVDPFIVKPSYEPVIARCVQQ